MFLSQGVSTILTVANYLMPATIVVGKMSSLDEATLDYFKSGAELNKVQLETQKQKRTLQNRALRSMEKSDSVLELKRRKLQLQIENLEIDQVIKYV